MQISVDSRQARARGLFVFIGLALLLVPLNVFAQAPDDSTAAAESLRGGDVAARTPPPKLPPTQESVRRQKMRAQLRIEGENKFRYAREMQADGYLVRSRQLLQDFLILFPEHDRRFAALEMLAQIAEDQDQPEQAVAAYRRAYAAVPGEDRGLTAALQAGRLLAGMGRTDEAKALFQEIQARKPDSKLARLVAIELQALGLPVLYDRFAPAVNNGDVNNSTDPDGEVRQNSGPGRSDPAPAEGDGNSDRGLLDGTTGVPTDDGMSPDSTGQARRTETESGPSGSESAPATENGFDQAEQASGGPATVSDEALMRMGEGVERPRSDDSRRP
ncbi:MAG: tetratricopeptide repeat protein [Leptospirales bacterium]|jgi:TolA-binding protein